MTTHTPDPTKRYVIGYSGGKDSTATWLYLTRDLKLPHVTCTFADTGHEHDETHRYLDLLERDHGLPLVRIQPILEDFRGELKIEKIRDRINAPPEMTDDEIWLEPLDMERLAILKRRFPSSMVRFCTEHLKLWPQRRWLRENCDMAEAIRVSGVRSQESRSREGLDTFSPDTFMGVPLWLPIYDWTHEQVFDLHEKHGVPPNPLYLRGHSRVGCNPCLYARKGEIAEMGKREPEIFTINLRGMEQRVAAAVGKPEMSFFSRGKTPARFHSATCENSGKTFPTSDDVLRWAMEDVDTEDTPQGRFDFDDRRFGEDVYSCSSKYGLCE